jgi:Amt family ammonium transporter
MTSFLKTSKSTRGWRSFGKMALMAGMMVPALSSSLFAADMTAETVNNELSYALDNFLLFICGVLVLFMQAGFAMLEAGLNDSKNTVNILCKNLVDLCAGVILYYIVGYGLMYPGEGNGYFAFGGSGIADTTAAAEPGSLNPQVDFLFQAAFAATAATIVSGAVAGRMKFVGYLIYTVVLTGLIYPVSGYWKWGGGWLDAMGFYDFAGSIIVHAVGGFAGLAGAIVLGPRIGRFVDGKAQEMPGHSLTSAALGTFILLIGWFGFNPGSQLALAGPSNVDAVMTIATNTLLAAAAGGLAALALIWAMSGKPKLSMALNGLLGGLVGITANCDGVTNGSALVIGAVAGVIVVFACMLLEALKIDDTVGAFPVHGAAGIWGGLATGIFGNYGEGTATMSAQLTGSIVVPLYAFGTMLVLFLIMKAAGLLRTSEEHETRGLDATHHGEGAYGSIS